MIVFFFFYSYDAETNSTVQEMVESVADFDEQELEFFFDEKIRKVWHKQQEEWYFSIVDVIESLTESSAPQKYWSKLKTQLNIEGVQLSTICRQLKMKSRKDGKMYKTDCANTEQLLRIIQSIPSKKAEPFKQWLAMVGKKRLDEMADPEKAMDRAVSYYKAKGYSDSWITQRLRSIEIRKEMTDEWQRSSIKDHKEYAALTNILTHAWSGKTVQQYKQFKNLPPLKLTVHRLN